MTGLANWLTLGRIAVTPVLVAAFYVPGMLGEALCFGLVLVASMTDWLDGYVARSRGEVTAFGGAMDSAADKMLVLVALLMLAGTGALSPPSLIAAAIVLLRDVFNAGLRAVLAQEGVVVQTLRTAKWKTAVQMVAVAILVSGSLAGELHPLLPRLGDWLLWLAAGLALWSVSVYCVDAFRQLQNRS